MDKVLFPAISQISQQLLPAAIAGTIGQALDLQGDQVDIERPEAELEINMDVLASQIEEIKQHEEIKGEDPDYQSDVEDNADETSNLIPASNQQIIENIDQIQQQINENQDIDQQEQSQQSQLLQFIRSYYMTHAPGDDPDDPGRETGLDIQKIQNSYNLLSWLYSKSTDEDQQKEMKNEIKSVISDIQEESKIIVQAVMNDDYSILPARCRVERSEINGVIKQQIICESYNRTRQY